VKKEKKAPHVQRRHVERPTSVVHNEVRLLIAIRVVVAPLPVILLVLMLPMLVRNIRVMAFLLVVPIGTIFAVIPVVIVVVMRVVDANLNMLFLCRGREGTAYCQSCRQEQSAN